MTRIFKIGSSRIVEDETMIDLSTEDVRERLKLAYPEVANATIRETTDDESGITFVSFIPVAGRKG